MISKEYFCDIINKVIKEDEWWDQINNFLRKYGGECPITDSSSLVIELLEDFGFDKPTDWVGYWMYDLDHGTKYEPGCVTDENGNHIDISTPEKLYDFIEKETIKQ